MPRADYPLIQGIQPDSWNEVYIAQALDLLKLAYRFQYSIYGGARLRGGIIVDFVVYNPQATPVEVFGEHWHGTELDPNERIKLAAEQQYFRREPVIIWDYESDTPEKALQVCRERLKR